MSWIGRRKHPMADGRWGRLLGAGGPSLAVLAVARETAAGAHQPWRLATTPAATQTATTTTPATVDGESATADATTPVEWIGGEIDRGPGGVADGRIEGRMTGWMMMAWMVDRPMIMSGGLIGGSKSGHLGPGRAMGG